MDIIEETEKMIAELPAEQAVVLKYWLNEFEATRRYKQLKGYAIATEALARFQRSNSDASLN